MICNHEGIGEPGCYVCDPDKGRVISALRAEVERLTKDMAERLDDSERIIAARKQERDEARTEVARLREHIRKGDRFIGAVERADRALAEVERLTRERDEARAVWITGICSEHQEPDPLCRLCNQVTLAQERQHEAEKERDEARRQLAAVGGYKAWTLDRAALHERAEKAEAEAARLREALTTIERTGAPGATIVAPSPGRLGWSPDDEHSCSWCRGVVMPCPVVTAREALKGGGK